MIYVIGERRSGLVKIGTAVDPSVRVKAIQAGNHRPLQVLVSLPGGRREETSLHRAFAELCVGGEWFDFGSNDPVTAVAAALDAPTLPDRPAPTGPRESSRKTLAAVESVEVGQSAHPLRITLVGCKGGVGTSTAAVMLGFVLAAERVVTVHDVSSTRGVESWARPWAEDDDFPFAVSRGWPTRYTSRRGGIEIIDMGRWADHMRLPSDPGVTILVATPGNMELHQTRKVLSEMSAVDRDDFGVLIGRAGEVDADGEPVGSERAFRESLAATHPDVAVFRDSIPARHPKHGDGVDYAEWYGCAPLEDEDWLARAWSRVARDILDADARRNRARCA